MHRKKRIILADDQLSTLSMGRELLSEKYEVFTVPSGEKLLSLLEQIVPDLILLDIEMPGMSGFDTIRALKSNPKTSGIQVIFLTSRSDAESELEGLSLGAIDYISKPFSSALLLKRIEVHMLVEEQRRELQGYNEKLEYMVGKITGTINELQNAVIETMSELMERRDGEIGSHVSRTRKYMQILIEEMLARGLCREQTSTWNIEQVILSSQLHDVGKIAIKDNILKKPSKLTGDEFSLVERHTTFGGSVIESIQKKTSDQQFLEYAKILTLYHHEKWDGSGYPFGLSGAGIPLLARLMAIVDVYDALISERPYRQAFSHSDAVVIIEEGKGTQFDPALVDVFLRVSDRFCGAAGLSGAS